MEPDDRIIDEATDQVDTAAPGAADESVEPGESVESSELIEPGESGDPVEALRSLIYYLATNLVDDPSIVDVEIEQRGSAVQIGLRVPEEELGKVIGRQGRIARALRTVLTIAGSRYNLRVGLDIQS